MSRLYVSDLKPIWLKHLPPIIPAGLPASLKRKYFQTLKVKLPPPAARRTNNMCTSTKTHGFRSLRTTATNVRPALAA